MFKNAGFPRCFSTMSFVCTVGLSTTLAFSLYVLPAVAGDNSWQGGHWQSGSHIVGDGWQVVGAQGGSENGSTVANDAAGQLTLKPTERVTGQATGQATSDKHRSIQPPVVLSAVAQAALAAPVQAVKPRLLLPVQNVSQVLQPRSSDNPTELEQDWQNPKTINLDFFVGEVRVLGRVDVSRVAVGQGAIIKAEVLESGELLVIASAPGSSSLRLWHKDGVQSDFNIRVSATDPETRVRMERTVRMRVRMVEFRKSALGRLGVDWSDGTSGPTLATAGDAFGSSLFHPATQGFEGLPNTAAPFSAYFGIASNISSRINFMAQNGDAVTLAEPVLSAMNGGEASFLAGGEVPYPVVGENGQTVVEFKEYGVKLNVAPLIDDAGNVRTRLETEISQLDPSVTVQGTPGLLTRRAQTEITVHSGQTIVISGLLSSESGTDADMIPGLGRLPIIGRFFGTRSQRKSVNELVIFVTPEVIEPHGPAITSRETQYLNESEKRARVARQQLPLME